MLYKFLAPDIALQVLQQKQLKLSRLTELNDVFDVAQRVVPPPEETQYTEETWTERIIAQLSKDFGLLCLSETCKSPLLWGHYSLGATGLALGFDRDSLFEPFSDPDRSGYPLDVDYQDTRPVVPWVPLPERKPEDTIRMIEGCFGVKAKAWEYEEELRYVLPLAVCRPVAGAYFVAYSSTALRQVVIGCRSRITPEYLRHFLQHHYQTWPFDVRMAHLHATRFEIELSRNLYEE